MCGRYLFSLDASDAAEARLMELFSQNFPQEPLPQGEIFPGSRMPVLTAGSPDLTLKRAKWGYEGQDHRPIINARWETAVEKPMFRQGMASGRCVIPASGFYEWSPEKEKFLFSGPSPLLYLAGLCRLGADGLQFVILTQPANRDVRGIHHRMPILLPQNALRAWTSGASQITALPGIPLTGRVVS